METTECTQRNSIYSVFKHILWMYKYATLTIVKFLPDIAGIFAPRA